jgi:LuxR family transcriptional activator of bioluminescence operon
MLLDYLTSTPTTLLDTVALLGTVRTKKQMKAVCEQLVRVTGLNHYTIALCRPSSLVNPQTLVIDNLPDAWCTYYAEHQLSRSNPSLDYCMSMSSPALWSDIMALPRYQQSHFRETYRRAGDFGLRSGLSVPLRAHCGEFGMYSLACSKDDQATEARLRAILPLAQFIGGHIMDAVMRNDWLTPTEPCDQSSPERPRLTERECECLVWASEGKTAWEISRILSIRECTVLFHLNNAAAKLGAVNRQHAIAKGLLTHAIRPLLHGGDKKPDRTERVN